MEFLYVTTQWWHMCDWHFTFLRGSIDIIQVRWKMFTWFCSKFIPETIHKISSKSPKFCRRYYKKRFGLFFFSLFYPFLFTLHILNFHFSSLSFHTYHQLSWDGQRSPCSNLEIFHQHLQAPTANTPCPE